MSLECLYIYDVKKALNIDKMRCMKVRFTACIPQHKRHSGKSACVGVYLKKCMKCINRLSVNKTVVS